MKGETIKRTYDLGQVRINIKISDGVAVLTTSNPQITKQMFEMAKKGGKAVIWEARVNAMVEQFSSLDANSIASKLDIDFNTALLAKKDAEKMARGKDK